MVPLEHLGALSLMTRHYVWVAGPESLFNCPAWRISEKKKFRKQNQKQNPKKKLDERPGQDLRFITSTRLIIELGRDGAAQLGECVRFLFLFSFSFVTRWTTCFGIFPTNL